LACGDRIRDASLPPRLHIASPSGLRPGAAHRVARRPASIRLLAGCHRSWPDARPQVKALMARVGRPLTREELNWLSRPSWKWRFSTARTYWRCWPIRRARDGFLTRRPSEAADADDRPSGELVELDHRHHARSPAGVRAPRAGPGSRNWDRKLDGPEVAADFCQLPRGEIELESRADSSSADGGDKQSWGTACARESRAPSPHHAFQTANYGERALNDAPAPEPSKRVRTSPVSLTMRWHSKSCGDGRCAHDWHGVVVYSSLSPIRRAGRQRTKRGGPAVKRIA